MFSASTWNTISKKFNKIPNVQILKNVCLTRWSSRHSLCKSIKNGYVGVLSTSKILFTDSNKWNVVKHEAKSNYYKIKSLLFIFLSIVLLLERFDKTSNSLQLINIDWSCVVFLYDS